MKILSGKICYMNIPCNGIHTYLGIIINDTVIPFSKALNESFLQLVEEICENMLGQSDNNWNTCLNLAKNTTVSIYINSDINNTSVYKLSYSQLIYLFSIIENIDICKYDNADFLNIANEYINKNLNIKFVCE